MSEPTMPDLREAAARAAELAAAELAAGPTEDGVDAVLVAIGKVTIPVLERTRPGLVMASVALGGRCAELARLHDRDATDEERRACKEAIEVLTEQVCDRWRRPALRVPEGI